MRCLVCGWIMGGLVLGVGGCGSGPEGTGGGEGAGGAGGIVGLGQDAETVVAGPGEAATRVRQPVAVGYTPRPGDRAAWVERVAYGSGQMTKLPADYLHRRLTEVLGGSGEAGADAEVRAAFDRLAGGEAEAEAWADLIDAVELDFVHRAETSALDLLGLELSERFRSFAWEANDYPGGEEGPNEAYAGTLADALDGVTPERRANRTAVSVIVRGEATEDLWSYMLGQWRDVPGEDQKKLNRHAVEAYVAMRAAAAADGVELRILSGHRDPQRAKANAQRAGNSFAVASFSSHSLGLAIDVALPRPAGDAGSGAASEADAADITRATDQQESVDEVEANFRLTTRPMSAVVDMRRSPTHKWLHLRGREFGWYPFQHEPWHWEYNPPGFREVFFDDYAGQVPPRDPESAGEASP